VIGRAVNRQFNRDSRHKWPRRTDKSVYQFLRSAVPLTVVENRRHDEGWWRFGVRLLIQTDDVERGETAVSMVNDNQFQYVIHPYEIVTLRVIQRMRQTASETRGQ
jgi:hypothetical protein